MRFPLALICKLFPSALFWFFVRFSSWCCSEWSTSLSLSSLCRDFSVWSSSAPCASFPNLDSTISSMRLECPPFFGLSIYCFQLLACLRCWWPYRSAFVRLISWSNCLGLLFLLEWPWRGAANQAIWWCLASSDCHHCSSANSNVTILNTDKISQRRAWSQSLHDLGRCHYALALFGYHSGKRWYYDGWYAGWAIILRAEENLRISLKSENYLFQKQFVPCCGLQKKIHHRNTTYSN